MKYKILITDVDGTLIAPKDTTPGKKVTEAIKKIKRHKNISLSLATARPYSQIKKICKQFHLSGFSIVSGGAQLVDVQTGKYYYEYPLEYKKTREICTVIKNINNNTRIWIQDNGIDYLFNKQYKPVKPLVIVVHGLRHELATAILKKCSFFPGIFCTKTSSREKHRIDINISHKKATKKTGILAVAKMLGITKKEIIGVGDSYNDYSLFDASGLKVAMGNAVQEVKALADYIAPRVEHDGVAAVIQKYFLEHNTQ